MKVKLATVYSAKASFDKLLEKEFPVQTAYKLSKMARKINEEFTILEESRMKLVKKYGESDEQSTRVPPEKLAEFVDEFNKLLLEEIEIDVSPISIADFGDSKVSSLDLYNLNDFISD